MQYHSYSEEQTKDLAYKLGQKAKPGDIYCLTGDIGAGKTIFSKGFALGIGIRDPITSPTFNIVNEYAVNEITFYHFDVYRISHLEEMEEIGYEEYFFGRGICLIEWADLIRDILPDSASWISIERDVSKGPDYRRISLSTGEDRR